MGAVQRSRKTAQLTLRISQEVLDRVERLTEHVGRKLGMPATRTDVLREAVLRGLEVIERATGVVQEKTRRP